jgi:hypothetical protein
MTQPPWRLGRPTVRPFKLRASLSAVRDWSRRGQRRLSRSATENGKFTIKASMNEAKFDALEQYRTSSLFTDAERAALDYVTELTKDKKVNPETFVSMSAYYSEREICEIVWLVASEHLYNMTNIGLNIHSDMLCDIGRKKK